MPRNIDLRIKISNDWVSSNITWRPVSVQRFAELDGPLRGVNLFFLVMDFVLIRQMKIKSKSSGEKKKKRTCQAVRGQAKTPCLKSLWKCNLIQLKSGGITAEKYYLPEFLIILCFVFFAWIYCYILYIQLFSNYCYALDGEHKTHNWASY